MQPETNVGNPQPSYKLIRRQAMNDAAVLFSSHLDRFATHAEIAQLSGLEIIELLRQESEKFNLAGFDALAHRA
ncbi:DUF2732 family protein [Sodalis sp. RH15]|uniref:DUF2732 family protein n=1 Tax=Sodalis sp. RH15 TaxID=3394330 RepID=UPI0039B6296D